MTIAQEIEILTEEEIVFPPSDLYSDEPPLETDIHLQQIIILLESLNWIWQERNDFYAAGNLTIYYSSYQKKSSDFRGPDFFVVLDTERKSRKSWVVWEENGQYPHVIIEILSSSTATIDKNLKKQIYQNIFRTPEYYWFDPDTKELAGFNLVSGEYQAITTTEQGYLLSKQLGLYLGVEGEFLRFFTLSGDLVLKPVEVAIQTQEELSQTQEELSQTQEELSQTQEELSQTEQRLQDQTHRAERLAAKLRELNIDPDTI